MTWSEVIQSDVNSGDFISDEEKWFDVRQSETMLHEVIWYDYWSDVQVKWIDGRKSGLMRSDVMLNDLIWCEVMWCDKEEVILSEANWNDMIWADLMKCEVMWSEGIWCDVKLMWYKVNWSDLIGYEVK